jgi:hypothetical protein
LGKQATQALADDDRHGNATPTECTSSGLHIKVKIYTETLSDQAPSKKICHAAHRAPSKKIVMAVLRRKG